MRSIFLIIVSGIAVFLLTLNIVLDYGYSYNKGYRKGFSDAMDTATNIIKTGDKPLNKTMDSFKRVLTHDLFRLRMDSARMAEKMLSAGLPKYHTSRKDSILRIDYLSDPYKKKTFKEIFKVDTNDARYKRAKAIKKISDSMDRIGDSVARAKAGFRQITTFKRNMAGSGYLHIECKVPDRFFVNIQEEKYKKRLKEFYSHSYIWQLIHARQRPQKP